MAALTVVVDRRSVLASCSAFCGICCHLGSRRARRHSRCRSSTMRTKRSEMAEISRAYWVSSSPRTAPASIERARRRISPRSRRMPSKSMLTSPSSRTVSLPHAAQPSGTRDDESDRRAEENRATVYGAAARPAGAPKTRDQHLDTPRNARRRRTRGARRRSVLGARRNVVGAIDHIHLDGHAIAKGVEKRPNGFMHDRRDALLGRRAQEVPRTL